MDGILTFADARKVHRDLRNRLWRTRVGGQFGIWERRQRRTGRERGLNRRSISPYRRQRCRERQEEEHGRTRSRNAPCSSANFAASNVMSSISGYSRQLNHSKEGWTTHDAQSCGHERRRYSQVLLGGRRCIVPQSLRSGSYSVIDLEESRRYGPLMRSGRKVPSVSMYATYSNSISSSHRSVELRLTFPSPPPMSIGN